MPHAAVAAKVAEQPLPYAVDQIADLFGEEFQELAKPLQSIFVLGLSHLLRHFIPRRSDRGRSTCT